jgi:hypothetical protein
MKTLINSSPSAKVLSPRNAAALIFRALVVAAAGNTAGAQACPPELPGAKVTAIPVAQSLGGVSAEALSPNGKNLWLAGPQGITVVDPEDLTPIKTFDIESPSGYGGPSNIAFSPPGGRVFVAAPGSVLEFDGNSLEFVLNKSITVNGETIAPGGLVADADHILVAIGGYTPEPSAVELDSSATLGRHEKTYIPGAGYIGSPALIPATGGQYGGKFLIPFINNPNAAGFGAGGGNPGLVVVEPATGEVIKTQMHDSTTTFSANSIAISPDGQYAYVSLTGGIYCVEYFSPASITPDDPVGPCLGRVNGVWVVSLKDLTTKSIIDTCSDYNGAVALSADGKHLLMISGGGGFLFVMDTATETAEGIVPAGGSSIALTPDGSKAFVGSQVVTFNPPL